MTLRHRILLAVIIALGALILFASYLGVFERVTVTEGTPGPFAFVYRDMSGTSMSQVGTITSELDALLSAHGLANRKPLDAFFPDGHAEIGFAIDGVDQQALAGLGSNVKHRDVRTQRSMIASFPWRSRLSFIVGAAKTDPAFADYRAQHGYAKSEAYMLNTGDTILCFQPILLANR
ncbi:MAG: hypothetical protein U0V87_01745 [Acidobacteriota bacterium]